MVATVVNIPSASSGDRYFLADGFGSVVLGAPDGDGPDDGRPDNGGGAAGYYARAHHEHRKSSHWRGTGAAALGLRGHIESDAFRRVLEGYVPGTDIRLGRVRDGAHEHRPGVDITLSAPKSVSLEALLPGPGNARAMRAHDAAVRATLDFIEARLLKTRRWDPERGRSVQVNALSLVAATFRHVTSRNNDPQLHTHCVVANMTQSDGRWRSVEIGLLRRHERLIGAYYRNELALRLRKAGFALRPSMIGAIPGFEIAGWPKEALEAFSSRRRDILAYIRERGWRYDARTAQAATLATRKRKQEPCREALEALWTRFAAERGLAKQKRRTVGVRNPEPPTALEIAWRAVAQLEERASVFPRREALALALAHSPGQYDLAAIERAFAELERDRHLIPAIRRGVGEAWTTARAVNAEREVIERMRAGIGAVAPLTPSPLAAAALDGLTDGQRAAARLILTSPDRTVGVQGYAGTGKTVMLRRVAALAGNRRVVGLAPSASAARTLARETGLGCRTLQWLLARCRDVADGVADAETLDALKRHYAGAVIIVDEMSLAGTAQARALLRTADRLDVARLVLVGDSRQLRAVEAGQPFRQLQDAGMATAVMDEVRRQRDPDLRAAVLDLIDRAPAEALDRLGGNLHEVPAEALGATAAALWLRLSPEARAGTALLAPTRALRADINAAVREGLETEGALHGRAIELDTLVSLGLTRAQVGDARHWREGDVALFHRDLLHYRIRANDACTVTEVGEDRIRLAHPDGRARHLTPSGDIRYRLGLYEPRKLRIREGERLRWTRNDTPRGLINGEHAEVRAIGDSTLTLRVATGDDIVFDHTDPQLRHLAYAYASTVHGAQGQTHERVIAVLDSGFGHLSNQQTFYVQLSRARENAVVLTDNREQLVETLEANTGERITALDAIGETAAHEVPAKAEVVAEEAAAFVERLRAEREREAAAEAVRETAHRVDTWLDDAERILAPRPAEAPDAPAAATPRFVDGYEQEVWRIELETLVTEGRTVVREAVASGAVETQAATRVRETMEQLERVLGLEQSHAAERVAVAQAEAWFLDWVDAEDPDDPFRPRSPTATVEEGRRIAADPALTDDWRRSVIAILDGHDAREKAVNTAEPWLRAWERFERALPDRAAAFDAPEAPVRIARARALLDTPGLPLPLERPIAAVVAGYDAHHAGRAHEAQPREAAADGARGWQGYRLDAARAAARRRTAEALHASDRLRHGLDRLSRDDSGLEASAERCGALAADARNLAPNLPQNEASRLAEAVRNAGHRLRRRLADARGRLQLSRDWLERAWPNHYHDQLRADWDAHRASDAFHPEDVERHRPWMDGFRALVQHPHLDPGNHEALARLLHDYDTAWPHERRRCVEAFRRWNDLVERDPDDSVERVPEFDALALELRALMELDALTMRERELIRAILRAHDEHREKSRQRSMGIGP